jgi:hypothetical protein
MFVGRCPYCLVTVQFNQVGANAWMIAGGQQENISVRQCPQCGGVHAVFFIADTALLEGSRKTGQWPLEGVPQPHPAMPPPVASDWAEAHMALSVGLWKSAVIMARRAVQGVCLDKGAGGKKTLHQQINELSGTQTLHPTLVEWSHKIRSFGNIGAHPGDDGLADVDQAEARGVVDFLDQLLVYVYEMPDRLSKLIP